MAKWLVAFLLNNNINCFPILLMHTSPNINCFPISLMHTSPTLRVTYSKIIMMLFITRVILQLLTYIILAAAAISTEVVYLAYKGNSATTWSETCGSFSGFCRKATASIAITFVVTLCYAGLSLISSYRLFSKYDAPIACTTTKPIVEVSTFSPA